MANYLYRIQNLSPQKRALLERKLLKKMTSVPDQGTIPRRDLSCPCPLSNAQQRLWFLDQFEPGSPVYNIPASFRLSGLLDVAVLEQSLNKIVRRHEALRTTFSVVEEQPVQVIAPPLTLTLPVVDLRDLSETEREVEARRLATEEAQRPFDLGRGPLLRATLLRLDEAEHVLLLTMHHIVSDGWSMRVLFRELSACYEAFSIGKPSPLPELPIQYADFAVWQRQWLQGEVLESQLAYWKQQLGGSLPVLELPTDRPRPAVQTHRGAKHSLELSKDLTEALKSLSHQEGVTLFMLLLAAFKTLLYRYTGQQDIIVGTPIAGRNQVETEGLIGFFVNTLVLRTDLSGNPSFRELLGRVREVALGAYIHQDLPFEKLVEELQPERDLVRTPLFQVWFNMANSADNQLELSGLSVEPFSILETPSIFDLTLYVREQNKRIQLRLVYNADLFEQDRMVEMLEQFKHLLAQIVENPEKPILSYSLVTPKSLPLLPDPREVLPEPQYEPITTLFASWVSRTPEQPAVSQGERTWTYGELAESAHSVARALLAHGVKQGDVVAVFGPRSFGLIASMMGVLLSGGVLLTLDQRLPNHRRQLMLQEAKTKQLLYIGDPRSEDEWISGSLDIICIDPTSGEFMHSEKSAQLEAIHLPELAPDDAAYIFFTSGTTGVPKGVLGCHKGISHFLDWQRQTFAIGPPDRSAQLTGLSFDVVLRDVFLPLTSGATLCLPAEGDDLEPARILSWLEREQISVLHTVPSLAQSWLANVPPGVSLRILRWVFFAGEPLTETLVRRWREAFPEAGEIVNLYGPTETTLAKCCYRVPSDPPPGVQPVGSPLPETQALVLAENNQLCGIGEPGEIVLRTPFRSLGYINAPKENQQRFVKNPFLNDEWDLLYYTGDIGRYRPDGSLEILGRLDNQVKLRGVRIHPEEIETVLGQHPAIRGTVVIAREYHPGDKRLVAYVVQNRELTPTIDELRRFLKQKLPDYMVPSAFVMLETLPLTPNGKVDRRALPAPDGLRPELGAAYVAPQTEVERTIAAVWQEMLHVEKVGIHDNFFDIGGHSLLMIQIQSKLQEALKRNVSLVEMFQYPTVALLAKYLSKEQGERPSFQQIHDRIEKRKEVRRRRKQLHERRSKD